MAVYDEASHILELLQGFTAKRLHQINLWSHHTDTHWSFWSDPSQVVDERIQIQAVAGTHSWLPLKCYLN